MAGTNPFDVELQNRQKNPFDAELSMRGARQDSASHPPAEQQTPIDWADVPGMAMENAWPSASQFGSDVAQPFLHPVDTAKSLGNLALGAAQKLVPGEQESEKYADAVGQFFSDRYGGMDELKRTLATDPVGFLADLSTVLTGGGGLAARLPGMAGKAGKIAGAAGRVTDPLAAPVQVAGRAMRGVVNPAAQRLMKQGVTPTVGQIAGGGIKKAEDALSSIPVLGSAIGAGRQRANVQLNKAAYDRALSPIGESAKNIDVGSAGIAAVSDTLSSAYESLLSKVDLVPDSGLIDGIANAVGDVAGGMDPKAVAVLEGIVGNKVLSKLSDGVALSGEQLKVIQGELAHLASTYGGSALASDRMIGDALNGVQSAFRQALVRSNPRYAQELLAIDKGYANYVRLRKAGGAAGADAAPGFTPAQLRSAVKGSDKSVGKGDFARGRALMQDLSADATDVMGNNLPTSGTAERGMLGALVLGGAAFEPVTAATIGALSTPYLPGAQRAMAGALLQRPGWVRGMGQAAVDYGQPSGRASFQAGRNDEIQQRMIRALSGNKR